MWCLGSNSGTTSPPSPRQVAETCQLAVQRLEWLQGQGGQPALEGPYLSVDPAPPAEERDVGRLREALLDEARPLFERYRAMFALRDTGGEEAALALAEGEDPTGLGVARGWRQLSRGDPRTPLAQADRLGALPSSRPHVHPL